MRKNADRQQIWGQKYGALAAFVLTSKLVGSSTRRRCIEASMLQLQVVEDILDTPK